MVILLGARWYVLLLLYRASHEDKAQLNIVIYELVTEPSEEALRAILDTPVCPIDGEDRASKRICPLIYIEHTGGNRDSDVLCHALERQITM